MRDRDIIDACIGSLPWKGNILRFMCPKWWLFQIHVLAFTTLIRFDSYRRVGGGGSAPHKLRLYSPYTTTPNYYEKAAKFFKINTATFLLSKTRAAQMSVNSFDGNLYIRYDGQHWYDGEQNFSLKLAAFSMILKVFYWIFKVREEKET